ncbi:diguanylate cyclase [Marinobacter halodurans]|uniref:diguanylate cyclase n=1 Tax=Marinobacter halodurans TaxID=2528979 RepID=A0ABY1ZH28_9GAMM|nr:diguanylate cyclase [Marinobacter halodurans]TBW51852.1 diguanylate cyclase [Marinobacter halodurans]
MDMELAIRTTLDALGPVALGVGLVGAGLGLIGEWRRRQSLGAIHQLQGQVAEQERQLRNTSRELAVLFDHTAIAVVILDKQSHQAEYANSLALEAFGTPSLGTLNGDILVKPDAWADEPYDLRRFEDLLDQANQVGFVQFEWCFVRAPAYARWHRVSLNHLLFNGKPCLLATAVNTTERKLADAKRERRNRVLTALASRRALPETLNQVVAMVESAHPDFHCGVMLADEGQQALSWVSAPRLPARFRQATDGLAMQFGQAACGTAAAIKARVVSRDIHQDPRWTRFLSAADEAGFNACWSEPILSSSGEVLGTFCVYHTEPWEPGGDAIDALTEPLYLASLALEDALTRERLERSMAQEHLLRQLSTSLLEDDSPEDGAGIQEVLDTVGDYLGLDHAYVYEQDRVDGPFTRRYHWTSGHDAQPLPIGDAPHPDELAPLLEALQEDGYSIFDSKPGNSDARIQALTGTAATRGALFIPLYGDQRLRGILGFDALDAGMPWHPSMINTLRVIGTLISHALTRRDLLASLEYKALHDRLTGLFNRHKVESNLRQEILRCERYGNDLAVLLIDIDLFKQVNDTFGHGAGDDVLRALADLLRRELRAADISGRWGGEEFLILLPETDLSGARNVAEQLRQTAERHAFSIPRPVTISVGLAVWCSGDSPDTLVNRADEGLYRAKSSGRNSVQVAPAQQEESSESRARPMESSRSRYDPARLLGSNPRHRN